MGKSSTTTQDSRQTSQLFAAPAGILERGLTKSGSEQVGALQAIAESLGRYTSGLEGLSSTLMKDFRGLPSPIDAVSYIKGGTTPAQVAELDRIASRSTRGARMNLRQNLGELFDVAQGNAALLGATSGAGGSFMSAPIAEVIRGGSQAYGALGAEEANIRANVGSTIGQGILTANQAALGNLRGIGELILASRTGEGGLRTGAGALSEQIASRLMGYRVATGRTEATGSGTSRTSETDIMGGIGQGLGLGLNALALFGMGGIGPLSGLKV